METPSAFVYLTDSNNYDLKLPGSFEVTSGNTALSINGDFDLHFEVNGTSISLPATVTGQLPAHSGSTVANGIALNSTVLGFANRQYRLTIYESNGILDQTVSALGPSVQFTDIVNNGNASILSAGISGLALGIVTP